MNKVEAIVIIALFALFCEPQSVNKIFDFVVPVYSLTALVIFVVHLKASLRATDDADNEEKEYKWTKNKVPLSWKDAFVGKWVYTERKGLPEFVKDMGVPSLMASVINHSGCNTEIKKNGDKISLVNTGFPKGDLGGFQPYGEDGYESAKVFSMNDGQDGKPMNTRVYFEEDTKMLVIHSIHTIKDKVVVVKRWIDESGFLHQTLQPTVDGVDNHMLEITLKRA